MILVGRYRSPFTRRVAVTLKHYGMNYEHRPITAWAELEAVQALNPVGRVPALILDDGEILFESALILDHLDEVAGPARALTPTSGPRRRQVLRLAGLSVAITEKAVAVVYERSWRPAEKQHAPWIERCHGQAAAGLAALEAIVRDAWLMGEEMAAADVAAGVMYDFIRLAVPELLPQGRYPNLDGFAKRCAEVKAFAETQPEPG
jgi:glutathione S-transferase